MARNRHSLAKFLKRSMGDGTGRSRSEGKKLDIPVRVARIGSACRFGAVHDRGHPRYHPLARNVWRHTFKWPSTRLAAKIPHWRAGRANCVDHRGHSLGRRRRVQRCEGLNTEN